MPQSNTFNHYGDFFRTLSDSDYLFILDSTQPGETLQSSVIRWAKQHRPEVIIKPLPQ